MRVVCHTSWRKSAPHFVGMLGVVETVPTVPHGCVGVRFESPIDGSNLRLGQFDLFHSWFKQVEDGPW